MPFCTFDLDRREECLSFNQSHLDLEFRHTAWMRRSHSYHSYLLDILLVIVVPGEGSGAAPETRYPDRRDCIRIIQGVETLRTEDMDNLPHIGLWMAGITRRFVNKVGHVAR